MIQSTGKTVAGEYVANGKVLYQHLIRSRLCGPLSILSDFVLIQFAMKMIVLDNAHQQNESGL